MFINTFNVPAVNGQARQDEITAMSQKYQFDVTCIQEHRIDHSEDTVKHQDLGSGWMIITSSAEKAENNATIRGAAMLVSPRAYKSLFKVESLSPRMMVATFNGNPQTTFIYCYSSTICSDEIEAVEFYRMLQVSHVSYRSIMSSSSLEISRRRGYSWCQFSR